MRVQVVVHRDDAGRAVMWHLCGHECSVCAFLGDKFVEIADMPDYFDAGHAHERATRMCGGGLFG